MRTYKIPKYLAKSESLKPFRKWLPYFLKDVMQLVPHLSEAKDLSSDEKVMAWCDLVEQIPECEREKYLTAWYASNSSVLLTFIDAHYTRRYFELLPEELLKKWLYCVDMVDGSYWRQSSDSVNTLLTVLSCVPLELLNSSFLDEECRIQETVNMVLAAHLISGTDIDNVRSIFENLYSEEQKEEWYKIVWLGYLHGNQDPKWLTLLLDSVEEWCPTNGCYKNNNNKESWGLFNTQVCVLNQTSIPELQKKVFNHVGIDNAWFWLHDLAHYGFQIEDSIWDALYLKLKDMEIEWSPALLNTCLGRYQEDWPIEHRLSVAIRIKDMNTWISKPMDLSAKIDAGFLFLVDQSRPEGDIDMELWMSTALQYFNTNVVLESEVDMHF